MNLTGQSNNLAQIQLAGREQSDVDKALSIKAVIWILLSLW